MDTIRTIRLYGNLGRFGRVHRLAVSSTAEAIRALCVLIPGFERELMTSQDRGIRYACFLGKKNIGKEELTLSGGLEDIRIAPVLVGAKRGGIVQTFIGAALIVVGVMLTPEFPTLGAALISTGVSMTIGGVVQMLSPQQTKTSTADSASNTASYNFNGPVNTSAQGNPVPVLYGRLIVGSAVISAGIIAEDQAYAGAPLPAPSIPSVIDTYGVLV